ncbi:amino acid ABC transporter substrate-binding protein (PAAT family) [Aestuariispira insulae]|uniref:Amino acid ABC transporter substrate-binding protein (PAAT family) n=2 Tax=Aestuariispira insulae TaxID=1461337 RepID=A0A3D9HJM2_9PROT|nr:amino acid ABC transporter substrate-binding protein (PAAT family) [Aestuariispira insulae]
MFCDLNFNIKNTLSKLFGLLIVLALLGASPVSARDFTIVASPQEPFKFRSDGEYMGIDVEVIQEVMKRLGVSYTIKLIKSDARIQEEAKKGKVDMLLLYSKKESRMAFLTYPEQSYVDISWNFFIRAEDEGKISYDTLDDLRAYTIGITKDVSYTTEFMEAGLKFETAPRNDLQIGKLLANRFDLVPLNTISTLYEQKNAGNLDKIAYLPKPLKTKPYYNVFVKASDFPGIAAMPAKYDQIIQELKSDGTIKAIFSKYLGDK